jgi:apolipoprotein N-acyltransferase
VAIAFLFRGPELLAGCTLLLFLFVFIYALNANMDYAQRFASSTGALLLAPDTTVERANAVLRFLPLFAGNVLLYLYPRLAKRRLSRRVHGPGAVGPWGLPLALISALLYAAALPSLFVLEGVPMLAFICLVPLFLALVAGPRRWAVFYGVLFGCVQTMIANYWLATYGLISLQFIVVVYLAWYLVFMTLSVPLVRAFGAVGLLWLPVTWVVFDYLRSVGFLGYPWAMLGTALYSVPVLTQISSVFGVWGVTFLVLLVNATVAYVLTCTIRRRRIRLFVPATVAGLVVLALLFGLWRLVSVRNEAKVPSARVALIQQNTDPRKDDYTTTFSVLTRLTDEALRTDPDLVAWSETAFVPNLRRWGAMDPESHPLARLVHRFRAYQRSIGTWLVTGNDDYVLETNAAGQTVRKDYNAAVLFSADGERMETYHKINLVPFTEDFPFREQLPWVYQLLVQFDVNLWERGHRRVVFHHPRFAFSTPICFEDGFPNDVRQFVRAGAEVILNLSNDYWSLTEVEAKQHVANSVFRAIENNRPLLRATASGETCHIDTAGRIVATIPYYEEGYLVTDVALVERRGTVYTALGDWFPVVSGLAVIVGFAYVALRRKPASVERR